MIYMPMTKVEGVPDAHEAKPGMAFFSGTGPAGKACGSCKFRGYHKTVDRFDKKLDTWTEKRIKVYGCAMFKSMTGKHGPRIEKYWAACKYYEAEK